MIQALRQGNYEVVLYIIDQKFPIKKEYLEYAIYSDCDKCIGLILKHIGIITNNLINIVCMKSKNPEVFNIIFKHIHPKLPQEQYFKCVVDRCIQGIMNYKRYYKNVINKFPDNLDTDIISDIIDIFIQNGFKLSQEKVVYCLKRRVKINNVFNYVNLDEKFWNICIKENYFPYDMSKLKPTIKILRELCSNKSCLEIIKQIKKNGLEPDQSCLEHACTVSSNNRIIQFLIEECNLKPTKKCFQNISNSIKSSGLGVMVNYLPNNIKINNNKKRKIVHKKELINDEINDTCNNVIFNTIKIKPTNHNILPKKKYNVTDKMIDFWDFNKEDKITFYQLRKMVLKYIKDNNLQLEQNKKIIKIDDHINNILNINKNMYLDIKDIDRLVLLFF